MSQVVRVDMPLEDYELCTDSGMTANWIVKYSWDKDTWEEIVELESKLRILKQNRKNEQTKANRKTP